MTARVLFTIVPRVIVAFLQSKVAEIVANKIPFDNLLLGACKS